MVKIWAERHLKGDPIIWFVVLSLSVLSILVVYSTTGTLAYNHMEGNTEHYLIKHSLLVGIGLMAMWLTHKIDYRYFSKMAKVALWISVPLLFITWQFGINVNEASRWIQIPIIGQKFQTSDLAKLALIASLASMLSKRQQNIEDFKQSFFPMLLWCGVICGLIALTNMSTAILLFLTCMLLMFIGRVPVKYLLLLCAMGILAGAIAISIGQRGETVNSRIEDFFNPQEIPFQAKQSYIAIATGGLTGKGPGKSDQRNLLPLSHTDFIFAIIIEEYGMAGGITVVVLYLILLYRGMRTVSKSDRAYGGLLSAGLSFALVLQAMVNMAVTVGLGPITGLPLPLLSMGGTSLLFTGLALGIILSVSKSESVESGNFIKQSKNIAY